MWLRRKKQPTSPSPKAKVPEVAWDEKTMEVITKADRFNVQITSATKRRGFGATRAGEGMREPDGYEISGVITYPKLIIATVSFDQQRNEGDFGFWFYNGTGGGSGAVGIPLLELCIADRDWKIREALFESHKMALLSGVRYSFARFWKQSGDGVMTAKDKEHGWSYESRYPLLGLYVFAEVQSPRLPSWAVPYAHESFSIENLPAWYDLRL